MSSTIKIRRIAPSEYRYGRLLISQADNGTWYVFDSDVEGGDSIDFGPTLADVKTRLDRRLRETRNVSSHSRLRFSPATIAKGRRLLDDGALTRNETGTVYLVAGDHGSYFVPVSADRRNAYCACPASLATCSHAAAVLLAIAEDVDVEVYEADDGNPFDGLTDSTEFSYGTDR